MADRVKKRPAKTSTSIEARYRELLAQEERVREQADRAQRALDQAPFRQEQQAKRRRDELLHETSRHPRSDFPSSLNGGRFNAVINGGPGSAARPRRALRAEKRHAQLKFLGLFFGLGLLLLWLYSFWH